MTTSEWVKYGGRHYSFWRLGLSDDPGDERCIDLNQPGTGHPSWQAYAQDGNGFVAGHTRADLRAYCEREDITLPELPAEWCPVEWEAWRDDNFLVSGRRVSVRSDDKQHVRLYQDGSWSLRSGCNTGADADTVASVRDCGLPPYTSGLPAARAYRTYAAEHGLPMPPADWWPEPVEEPAKPYSLADDPRLREVVRTVHGDARWRESPLHNGGFRLYPRGHAGAEYIAAIEPYGAWMVWRHPVDGPEAKSAKAPNPATAYDECMAALRDLGSLVDEEPATTTKPATNPLSDRLLNLADSMWFSDKPAASFAFDLRKLARELDGGGQ